MLCMFSEDPLIFLIPGLIDILKEFNFLIQLILLDVYQMAFFLKMRWILAENTLLPDKFIVFICQNLITNFSEDLVIKLKSIYNFEKFITIEPNDLSELTAPGCFILSLTSKEIDLPE